MRNLRPLACAVAAVAAVLVTASVAAAQTDATPPALAVATLSPVSGNNGWYRGPITLSMTATDDVAVEKFQYSINSTTNYVDVPVAPGPSASASVEITQEGSYVTRYRAVDTSGNISQVRQFAATVTRIDSRGPTATWPAIVNGRVGHTARLVPTRTDGTAPIGGVSGGVAVLDMVLDGSTIYPLPISTTDLSLGLHTIALRLGDTAGNGSLVTQRFVVTTSFADVDTLITRFVAAGSVSAEVGASLSAILAEAKALADAGSAKRAGQRLNEFVSVAQDGIAPSAARSTLVADARYLQDELNGKLPPEPATGLTVEPASGATVIPDPVLAPLPHNPDADFDVLVFSRTTGFRHDHIPHTVLAIQKLGVEHNFNVDVYDPQLPSVTLPISPFLNLFDLLKYETIVFESTVGHNPGPLNVAVERPNFEAYMRAGGGYVGIHGASDSARGTAANQWHWYGNLVGAWFTNHPNGQNGFGACGSCIHTEVVTEDHTHPATEHLPARWSTVDELYNFDRNPRKDVHTLLSLDEASYRTSLNSGNAANNPLALMNGDHPIAWCQNWDGGRAFSNNLGHARWQYYDASFMKTILGGIETTAGRKGANCSSYRETRLLVAGYLGDGLLTAEAADAATALLDGAQASYLAKDYGAAIPTLNAIVELSGDAAAGDAAARAELARQAKELRGWMQNLNSNRNL